MAKNFSKAIRIRSYGPNFGLYKVEHIEALNVVDSRGRQVENKLATNIVGVSEINFTGWTKGKTGKHRLDAENTNEIIVGTIRLRDDGKLDANDWHLINQNEVNEEYSKLLAWNI